MATLAPVTTPARQPFGVLNDSKLRNLQSLKNRQNAITPNSAPTSLKRRAVSPDGGSDSENVDPNILESLHKRKRSAFEDDVSISKSSRYSLHVTPVTSSSIKVGPRVNTPSMIPSPRLDTFIKPTPASAPAGRSPTRRRPNNLLSPRKRFNPPPFSVNTQSPGLTLSAALNGTKKARLQSQARKSRALAADQLLESSKPKSWFFDIYEESQEQQEYRMDEWTMMQDAGGLDISDDESKKSINSVISSMSSAADRGKENVDPNEPATISAPVTRSMAAAAAKAQAQEKDVNAMKTDIDDEPRSPLADLNPAEFYAEGLDATSVVLVHEDEAEAETDIEDSDEQEERDVQKKAAAPAAVDENSGGFTFQAPAAAVVSSSYSLAKTLEDIHAPSLAEILSAATPSAAGSLHAFTPASSSSSPNDLTVGSDVLGEDEDIEIWESESAKDENEKDVATPHLTCQRELAVLDDSLDFDDENVFACQEL